MIWKLSRNWLLLIPWGLLFILGIPYVGSHVAGGDSAELALAGATLGIPHSPGYPVFSLLHRLGSSFVFFGNPAYQQNLLSFVFILLGFALSGWACFRLSKLKALFFLPLLLSLTPLFHAQSFVVEVFPLAFAWFSGLMLVAFWGPGTLPRIYLFGLVAGLGLGVHQTLVFSYPGFLYYLIASSKEAKAQWARTLWTAFLFLVVGFLIHLYIPIRSMANPILDWENPETLRRFVGVLTRERYGFLQLAQGPTGRGGFLSSLGFMGSHGFDLIQRGFGWFGVILTAIGTVLALFRRGHRRAMISLWIIFVLTGPFFHWFAGAGSMTGKEFILNRFAILPLTSVLFIMAVGLTSVWKMKVRPYQMIMVTLACVMGLQMAVAFFGSAEGKGNRWNLTLREAGLLTLRQVPKGAILISDRADELDFSIAYLQGAENKRPDVKFVDANAGVSESIYGEDYYYIWGNARLERRETVENELVRTSTRPVFYSTVDPLMVNVVKRPWGSVLKAWFPGQPIGKVISSQWNLLLPWRKFPSEERPRQIFAGVPRRIGKTFFDIGKDSQALQAFGVAQIFGAGDRAVALGFLFQKSGKPWEARKYYQDARERGVIEESLFSNYGNLLMSYGKLNEAEKFLKNGSRFFPESIDVHYNLAVAYWRQRKWRESVQAFKDVLRLNPRHAGTLQYLPKAQSLARFSELQQKSAPAQEENAPEE